MRTTHQRSALAGIPVARAIVALTLLATLVLLLGQAPQARAQNAGTFGFLVADATVDEGDTLDLDLLVTNRDSVSGGNVKVGIDIQLITAEPGDVATSDFCIPISGNVGALVPFSIATNTDTDTQDETFSISVTFSTAAVPCASDGGGAAITGGQTTIFVTINDTTSGGGTGTPTFNFQSASSSADEDEGLVQVIVVRSGSLVETETVQCVVSGGSATAGIDYTFSPQTLTFSPGETQEECNIAIIDNNDATNETVLLHLTNPSAGSQVGTTDDHLLNILDSSLQTVEFSALTYSVDEDGGVASFTVTRHNPSGTVVVTCSTHEIGGEADAGVDYTSQADQLTFTDNQTTRTCTVPILDDNFVEGDETFRLELQIDSGSAVIGGNDQAIVTIVDDETSGVTYQFSQANYNVNENAGSVTVTIVRSTSTGSGSVHWATSNGTATAGADYLADSGTEFFSAGETQETFTVTILPDNLAEPNQTINLTLSNPVNGALGAQFTATITIIDAQGIPTVTSISPSSVPTTGATVVITGTNFTGSTAVTVCGVNVTSFTINSSTQITAVLPARSAGICDIRVTNPAGQSTNTAADNVTYQASITNTYQLSFRWSLIAWLGKDGIQISSALQGIETPDNASTNNVFAFVTAIATWDGPSQRYLFWFPGGASIPGANDITTFKYGSAYWVAVTTGVSWTILEGP